ncbi:MAG: 50S ribosomal protein L9 [bacterium]|nr:50S ribosomal protein L9 [bacterium]
MRVVLLKDVPKLGKKSDVKMVSPGYAKNFLFPRGLAMVLTSAVAMDLDVQSEAKKKQAERELVEMESMAQKLEGLEIEIPMKVSKEGIGYASLSAQKIAETLSGIGFKITKSQIKIKNPIKKLGDHMVMVSLPHGLESEVKIIVVEEE